VLNNCLKQNEYELKMYYFVMNVKFGIFYLNFGSLMFHVM